ncbi:hypothetical protein CU098_003296, partial [Rhizopus stolonifer]
IRHSPILHSAENQTYLPPMRSIWSESMNQNYSPPPHSLASTNTSSSSPPMIDMLQSQLAHRHHNSSPRQQTYMPPRDDTQRLSSFPSTPLPSNYKESTPQHHNWPGSHYDTSGFDHQEMIKRRKLSSPASSHLYFHNNNNHNNNGNHNILTKRTHQHHNHLSQHSPTVKVPNNISPMISTRLTPTTTDTYYHQSRRKKRDTKPPNANDIRPFVEVERAVDGSYILPAEVDSWTVLNLGTVVWDKAAFHNQRYIYPVGYRVKKWYRSMVDPHSDTQYTCEILDGGDEPIFQLNADDNPTECWRGPTPTTVWTIAVRRAFAIRNMDYGHNPVGPDFFGLRKNTIAKMIQDLPDADKCKNYIWQNFEVMSSNKGKSVRRTNTRIIPSISTHSGKSNKEDSASSNNTDDADGDE